DSEAFAKLRTSVTTGCDDEPDLKHTLKTRKPQRGLGTKDRRGVLIGEVKLLDKRRPVPTEPAGMRRINLGPSEVRGQESRRSGRGRRDERQRRRVGDHGRRVAVTQGLGLIVDAKKSLLVNALRQLERSLCIGRSAIARRVRRSRVRDVRLHFRWPRQT